MKKGSTTGSAGSHWQADSPGTFKVLQLKTGDTILAELDSDLSDFSYNPTIEIINPVKVIFLQGKLEGVGITQENFAIKPFLNLSDSVRFPISTDVIITMGDMKPAAKDLYISYVKKVEKQRQEERDDYDIVKLLESITPGGQVLFIEHETPMIVESGD